MAQVTYRGVKYDTDTRKASNTVKVEETYREGLIYNLVEIKLCLT